MANRYWVAATASNWNNTANWSTTSGGASGASVPGASDDVIFDSSAAGNCTVDANVDILSLDFASYAGTFSASTYTFTVAGDLNASGNTTVVDLGSSSWTVGGNYSWRNINGSSSEGTSTLRMTSTTQVTCQWKPSGGDFYSITLAPNASVIQGRNLYFTGSFILEDGSSWESSIYSPEVTTNATLTLGANSSILTAGGGTFYINPDGTGTRTGHSTATIGRFGTRNNNTGSLTTIPIATYTDTFSLSQNAASYQGTWRFEGDTVIEGNVSTSMSKATNETIDTATNNASLTLKGDIDITPGLGTITWSAGTGTITLDNTAAQAVNFNGQTVEAVIVSDASTGAITLGANFTTPYVHDCSSLIDLNGFTITETGTDPNPCSGNTYFFPAHFGGRL